MDDVDKTGNTWRVDDLDVGLVTGFSNLHGLGNGELSPHESQAYDMTQVLQLPMFKQEALTTDDLQGVMESFEQSLHSSLQSTPLSINGVASMASFTADEFMIPPPPMVLPDEKPCYSVVLSAPTAPGTKLDEETITWLNQSQSYEMILQCLKSKHSTTTLVKSVISIGFCERKNEQYEAEKYDEWIQNRPNDRMLEFDMQMCQGIVNPSHIGSYTNEIEFQWDPGAEYTRLFVKVNCLSSEFTKTKSGESGVPLRVQIDIYGEQNASLEDYKAEYCCGCKVKVFRAKGANRKLKLEKEKRDNMSKEEAEQVQPSYDKTILKELIGMSRLRHHNTSNPLKLTLQQELEKVWVPPDPIWVSPTSSQLQQLTLANSSNSSLISTPASNHKNLSHPQSTLPDTIECENLTANSTTEETQAWLQLHRFTNYSTIFSNFTGADLLRLSRSDMIQLCGPADGIRLNNALQARASRPLLTMYVSPEWHQSSSGMREYHAMFLEHLTVDDLKTKLAKKCGIEESNISALYKQGPTGIHIFIDNEMVRNFMDEAHHVVEVLKDPLSDVCCRILLK